MTAALPTVYLNEEKQVLSGNGASACKVFGKDAELSFSETAGGDGVEESLCLLFGWREDLWMHHHLRHGGTLFAEFRHRT